MCDMTDIRDLLVKEEFPLSSKYDPGWILDNQMGPNALWLAEWLVRDLPLEPGMRVLDLGCGKAMTSIFMAREFGVRVWAADLWITPDHNRKRAEASGVGDIVFPVRTEAHALPFSDNFFDAVVSFDAYQYFGTDVLYLGYLLRFIRFGGFVGMAGPGLTRPVRTIPAHLIRPQSHGKPFWDDECWSFKTAEWWYEHWCKNSSISNVRADTMKDGWRYWYEFEKALEKTGKSMFPADTEALEKDRGEYLGFVRAMAKRTGSVGVNMYDPAIASSMGVDR
ncbi:MAG: SAM-dependent methyltransferase [Desulfobacterales bacterium]